MTSVTSEALLKLQKQFAEQLPEKLELVRAAFLRLDPAAWQTSEAEVLYRLLHGLTGSAGTFGMHTVSNAARTLETLLSALLKRNTPPSTTEWQAFGAELKHLNLLAHSHLQSGAPSLKPPQEVPRLDRSPLIHLVEDDSEQAEHLKQALLDDGYRVQVFTHPADFRAACSTADNERPAAVIMDMIFPEGENAGAVMLAELRAQHARCPPVIFISVRDDLPSRLAAFRAGASRYLVKPVQTDRLIDLLDSLSGRQPAQPYRVLMVDDDPLLLEMQAEVLRAAGMEVVTLTQPLLVVELLNEFTPDVAVLDVYMPDASGPEIAAILRERDEQLHLPILFLSAETDMTQQLLALNLGGDDFLVKPVQHDHLVEAVSARARRSRQNSALRRRLETTLYEREREHLALNHHAIVSIADRAGNITYINEKFCKISGYSQDELMGHNHRLLKSGTHPPEFYRELWRTISSGKVWQGEICNLNKNGEPYWVASTITPFLDSNIDSNPYQYVSIRTDITQVKAAEAVAKRNEIRLNFILTMSPVVIFTCKAVDGFPATYVSPNIQWLFGYNPAEALAKTDFWASGIHPDDAPRVFAGAQTMLDLESYSHEYRFRMPDGSYRWIHDSLRVIRDSSGKPEELIGYWADIDDRVQAEKAAEMHKERLRRGQNYANIGTWDWNILTGELFWTERIAPLFGYATGELATTYDNFLAAIHPDDRQTVMDAVGACVERNVPYEIEHRVVWPDGTVRWLLERGGVKRDTDGRPLQMLGVVQDIDDRKRAELALIEHERDLREAQRLARLGSWSADAASGKLKWSDEVYVIFDRNPATYTPDLAAYYRDIVHPEDVETVSHEEQLAYQSDQRHNIDHRFIRPDGSVGWVHVEGQATRDKVGNVLQLSGTVQDISARIQAEALIRETKERFEFAVEGAGDGIWDWDMQSNAMQFSRLYMNMLGYAANELPHHADTWANSVHPDDKVRVNEQLRHYLEGKLQNYSIELRLRCKDGSYKWVLCRGTVVDRDKDEKPVRMIGIHSDISERKQAEQALVAAREEADRANQAKSEFLSSMSHELRTPMNAILGFGQLLEYDSTMSSEQKDNVHEILKAGNHLLELINEVLDLSKVESGNIDLSLEPVDVCAVVEECLGLIATLAAKRNIKISHQGLAGAAVRADRTRLRQVLLNLLSNAIKYNREGGSVHLTVKRAGSDRLRILVADTGYGIPADKLAQLFLPFSRLVEQNSEIEGTGIGLTITRRIVELMGGVVDVESEENKGSTFWIELPLEAMHKTSQDESPQRGKNTRGETATHEVDAALHKILYIEDNPANLRLVSQILGRRQHTHLLTAHTPELGIELALSHKPDLILLDINMPGMNGYQVLEVLRATASLKNIPVIAVTANAMPRDIERGRAAGFSDYLTKPIDIARLNSILDIYLLNGNLNSMH